MMLSNTVSKTPLASPDIKRGTPKHSPVAHRKESHHHAKMAEELIDHLAFELGKVATTTRSISHDNDGSYWNNTSDSIYLARAMAQQSHANDDDSDDDDEDAIWKIPSASGHHHQRRSVCLEASGNYWDESASTIDSYWYQNEKRTAYLWKWSTRSNQDLDED